MTVDITDRKVAEERQALLAREVDHRAKNALALVQSIVRLTRASDIAAYTTAVEGRIRALSRAHTILSLSRWQGADIARPRRGGACALSDRRNGQGRSVRAERVAAAGGGAVARAGAARACDQRRQIRRAVVDVGTRRTWPGSSTPARWSCGGRKAAARRRRRRRRRASARGSSPPASRDSSAGQTVFDWRPEGLQCVLSVPREDMAPVQGPQWTIEPGRPGRDRRRAITVAGNRVMIVEDEALVAMALREALDELGFSVIGPFNRISEAMIALRNNRIDAAVLDVNLGGELIYPLADVLAADHVPFIFITGYGAEEIEPRYAHVPVLQKPIEAEALKTVFVRPAISGTSEAVDVRRMVG